jgi:hypothetical protein
MFLPGNAPTPGISNATSDPFVKVVGRDAAVEREPRGVLFLGEIVKVRF